LSFQTIVTRASDTEGKRKIDRDRVLILKSMFAKPNNKSSVLSINN